MPDEAREPPRSIADLARRVAEGYGLEAAEAAELIRLAEEGRADELAAMLGRLDEARKPRVAENGTGPAEG